MKKTVFKLFSIALLTVSPALGQETTERVPANERAALIPGKISDGTPSPPAPPPVLPDFVVKSTVVREMDVVEAPPMSGLPPVEGTITTTVHVVEDPKLPDPPPPPVPANDPNGNYRIADPVENDQWLGFVFVSATVYDHSRTFRRCYPTQHHTGMRCRSPKADFGAGPESSGKNATPILFSGNSKLLPTAQI